MKCKQSYGSKSCKKDAVMGSAFCAYHRKRLMEKYYVQRIIRQGAAEGDRTGDPLNKREKRTNSGAG